MEAPDLGQVTHSSADALELRDRMAAFAVPHTLEPLVGSLDGLTTGVRLGDVKLAFVKYGTPTRVVASATEEQVCWTIPVGPMQVTRSAGHSALREGFLLDREQATVMLPSPHRGAVVVTTNATALHRHLAKLIGRDAPALAFTAGPSRARTRGQVDLAWRYVASSLHLTPLPPDALSMSLGETLLTALLFELPQAAGLLLDEPQTPLPNRRHADRAAEWAAEHFTAPVQVTEWARDVAISVRHLQAIMKEEFGCTPKEYLQRLRLQRAHSLLTAAPAERTIASIAHEAGFTHLGRFAALYREHYGLSPGRARSSEI